MKSFLMFVAGVAMTLLAFESPGTCQTAKENLKILEPLLNKKWIGELKSPDGSASYKTSHAFTLIGDGSVVKYTGIVLGLNSISEGYFYWDRDEKKVALFIISGNGVYRNGFVSIEEGLITVKGVINFPERKFDYKNTFEMTADGKMIDRWFQNAFGPWQPGHVVELAVEKPKK